jgi:hypothetical protein
VSVGLSNCEEGASDLTDILDLHLSRERVHARDTPPVVCAPGNRHPRTGPHYAACKDVGPGALRSAGLTRSRLLWTGRSFARLKQVSANLSHRARASGRPHCSAIATHAARRRRYSSESMSALCHANIHPQCITSMRWRQRNRPLDIVMSISWFSLGYIDDLSPLKGYTPGPL